jgi:XTP/dITP diphosphohydrolase
VLAATRNVGKQEEIRRLLGSGGLEIVFPDDIWLRESSEGDALEAADSFEANARRKAEYFARLSSLPTLADDSGLEVMALGGAPGVRSKRWAGATGSPAEVDAANNAELLRRLAGAPETVVSWFTSRLPVRYR